MDTARSVQVLWTAEKAVLLLAVAGIPLFFLFGYTLEAVNLPKVAAITALVSLALALRLTIFAITGAKMLLEPLVRPAAFLLVPLTLGWLFSDAKEWSLFGQYGRYQGLLAYLFIALLGLLLLDAFRDDAFPVAVAVAVAATGVASYGLLQEFGADPLIWGSDEMGSTLGNSNFTAQFLGVSIPVLLGTWHAYPKTRLFLKYAIVLVVVAWLLTRGEGGLLAGIVGVATFYGVITTGRRRGLLFCGAVAAAALGVAAIVGSVVLPVPEGKLISLKDRGWHWQTSIALIEKSPLVGHGPNGFALVALQERPKDEALAISMSQYVDDAYSVPLSFGVSAGVLGLVGFAAFVRWWLQNLGGTIRGARGVLAAGWVAAIAGYFTQSLFSFDEPSIRVLLWSCLAGLTITLHNRSRSVAKAIVWRRIVAGSVAVLVLPAGLWQSERMVRADHLARSGRVASESFDFKRSATFYAQAADARDAYWYGLQEATALGRAGAQLGADGEGLMVAMRERFADIEEGPVVTRLFQEAGGAAAYAATNPEWGEYAAGLYAEALRFDPWNITLSLDRARVLTTIGRYEDAITTLQPFIGETPGRADFWCRLAQAQRRNGDAPGAQASLKTAFDVDPGGAAALYRRGALQTGPSEPPCS